MVGDSGQEVFERIVLRVERDEKDRDRFDHEMRLDELAETLDAKSMRRIRRINIAGMVAASRFKCDLSVSSLNYYGAAMPGGEHLEKKMAYANAIARIAMRARTIEGDHYTIMQPSRVDALAETISADLAQASALSEGCHASRQGS